MTSLILSGSICLVGCGALSDFLSTAEVDPDTGVITVIPPDVPSKTKETIKNVAETGLSALEILLASGGGTAGILAALGTILLGKKKVAAKKAAKTEAKTEENVALIAEAMKRIKNGEA